MKHELTIIVAYGSWHIGARIIQRMSRIENVEIIGQANDAVELLAQIASKHPDLIILDVQLSQRTGLDVLRTAKEISSGPLVMMTSASVYPQYRKECLREGADYFYYLPEELEEMTTAVAELSINVSGEIAKSGHGSATAQED